MGGGFCVRRQINLRSPYLVRLVALLLNVVLPRSGTVPFYSPRALVVGNYLDMEAIGTTRFGELCKVHKKTSPTNTTKQERTMPRCI